MPPKNDRPPQPSGQDHYNQDYEDFNLWIDYWYQYSLIKETATQKILEIGPGTGTLSALMKHKGYQFVTVDNDSSLKADHIADITKLPFPDDSFDVVCAFEVLEHLPFEEFPIALTEMARVSRKSVIISLPYACFYFGFAFQPFYATFLKPLFSLLRIPPMEPVYFNLAIPFFFLSKQGMIKAHAWEMGRKGYSFDKVLKTFKKVHLKVAKKSSRMLYPYHYYFTLEKSSSGPTK